jgi:hypothetical protein
MQKAALSKNTEGAFGKGERLKMGGGADFCPRWHFFG